MDIRSLLLARTQTVVLDPDRVAEAATRPTRDIDLDRFEDDLAQLGFVMSLDLAMTIRRLPYQAIEELRGWILATLSTGSKPTVPLFAGLPESSARYLRRVATWLAVQPEQPCPWCAQVKAVVPLDPCGHLVCRTCWEGANFVGCAICHRRVTLGDPSKWTAAPTTIGNPPPDRRLRLVYLAFDVVGVARGRFETLLGGAVRMTPEERAELAEVIDAVGPKAAQWIPKRVPVVENLATALARLWITAPDRSAMMELTRSRIATPTDALRIAVVLLGGDASFGRVRRRSIPRNLRRAILGALDRFTVDDLSQAARERAMLWKRLGEVLHPFEYAKQFPNAAHAFAIARGNTTFAKGKAIAPNAQIEAALRNKDVRAALEAIAKRPDEMLRRYSALHRLDPSAHVYAAANAAIGHASPSALFAFAKHVDGDLRDAALDELVRRAAGARLYPRAVLDRALADHRVHRLRALTLWDVVAVHAAARGNVIYVRETTSEWRVYRRRDGETGAQRIARLATDAADSRVPALPTTTAPTWFAIVSGTVPEGSSGFVLDRDGAVFATELIASLTPR